MSDSIQSTTNHDGDVDSLFGSPPSSPSRGRSPSPLALPSGTAQNVGTLALPGSHLVAELPVNPPASTPLSANVSSTSHPPPSRYQACPPLSRVPLGSSPRRNGAAPPRQSRIDSGQRRSRKGKEREKSATPRPTPPPIPLPSPDQTPPPNFLRNQQALLGLAGMVGGVNPATLSKGRYTRGTTAENPIVVEEEPPQQPSIGKRPIRTGLADPSQLPRPSSEQILSTLLQQKNILPVVLSLLRLLVPGAPSLAQPPASHTPHAYVPPPTQYDFRYHGRAQTSSSDHAPDGTAPPSKRRKLNAVPAGAGDWDVPYPFPQGQGPSDYGRTWERDRGKQLLADLVQLVRGAAQKAAAKAWYQQQQIQQRVHRQPGVVVGYGPEPTVNKYYRPKTMYYGLERGPVVQPHAHPPHGVHQYWDNLSSGTSTPSTSAAPSLGGTLSHVNSAHVQHPVSAQQPPEASYLSSPAFDQLVESLLVAQQQQEQQPSASTTSAPSEAINSSANTPRLSSEESTQAFFDNWLEMLSAFPPGDPNEGQIAPSTSPTPNVEPSDNADAPPTSATASMQFPDHLIDPALLDLGIKGVSDLASQPLPKVAPDAGHVNVTPTSAVSSALPGSTYAIAPSLSGSPSATATSLADTTDTGPATPSWDWAFHEAPGGPLVQDQKLLEQWAEMEVDVDALLGEDIGSMPAVNGSVPGEACMESPTTAVNEEGRVEVSQDLLQPSVPHPSPAGHSDLGTHVEGEQASCFDVSPVMQEHSTDASAPCRDPVPPLPAPLAIPPPPFLPPSEASSSAGVSLIPPLLSSVVHTMALAGKTPSMASTGMGVGNGVVTPAKSDKKVVLERARKLRASLAAEVERAKIALWETTLEHGVLVGFQRELEKERRS